METAGDPGDVQTRQCGSCDDASASGWCVDCSEALCDACLAAHRRVTLTRSHRVLNRQPEGTSLISPTKFCRNHPSEELKLFCFTCCLLTCRDCQLADHKNHRFDFVNRAVESVKTQLDTCMQPFRAQMEASRRSLQDMETRLQVLAQCESFMTSKLQKHVDTLTELLKKRFEEIIKQMQVVYNVERTMISRKMEKVKQLQKSHVPLTEAAEKARSTTNLPTLVACISQITSQLKDLGDEDSRAPSKMIDVKVITDRSSVEGILNFGKLHVSWIPFLAPQAEPPSSSSLSLLMAPPTSTCPPLTCSSASANGGAVDAAASPSPSLGSTNYFITAPNRPSTSSRTRPQTGSGSDAALPAPPVRPAASSNNYPPVPSSSSSSSSSVEAKTHFLNNIKPVLPPKSSSVPRSTSAPPTASTFKTAVVKSRTAQAIKTRNPFLCSLLQRSSPPSSPPAGPHPSSLPLAGPHPSSSPPAGPHPSSLPPAGPHPSSLPLAGPHPSSLPLAGPHPSSLPLAGPHPSSMPLAGPHPSSLPLAGPHPSSLPLAGPHPSSLPLAGPHPSSLPLAGPHPSSSPLAGPSPSSTGLTRGQSSTSLSSSSLVSEVLPQTTTTKGPGRVEARAEGAKPAGKRDKETSRGSDSAVKINVLTKSQLESSSEKLFVKFQWRKKTTPSSSSSSSVAGSPKIKRLFSGKLQPLRTQDQPEGPVLPNPQTVIQSSPPVSSTYVVFPQAVSITSPSASIQPVSAALSLVPGLSPPNSSVQPSLILSQQVVPSQNPPAVLLLTNTSPTYPVIGSGPGLPFSVSVGPQALPGNTPSVQQSPDAPEIQNLPDHNNLRILEHFINSVGLPSSTFKDQQQIPASKPMNKPNKLTTETPNRLVEGSSAGIAQPVEQRSPKPNDTEPTVTGAPDQELIVVLSDEDVPAEDESLPDVYEVQATVHKSQSFLPPVSPGASDEEINGVEYEPPGDESKPRTSRLKQRDDCGEPASPVTSEDSISAALSEEPELGLKLSSTETSDSEDEAMLSLKTEQQDYNELYWQPSVSLVRLPLSLPGPGCPLPRYHFVLGDKKDEVYLQEVEEDDQSSGEDVSETTTDHASDITEDFTQLHSPESPLSLEVISCAACGSSSASKICTVCGRGYHRDCHIPPFGPDIWSELVCSLCQDLSDPVDPFSSDRPKSPHAASLSLQNQRRCETLLLHLKVEGCRRFSQLDLWPDLMLISERLSLRLPPAYQTPAQVVSDLWHLFTAASQGNRIKLLQQSFQKKLVETLGSELPASLLMAPKANAASGAEGPSGSFDSGENFLSESRVKVLKKRLKDFLDVKGPSAAKRARKLNPEDVYGSDVKN